MVAMLGGSKPNPFCKCTIVYLRTAFYTVNSAWLGGVEFFRGQYSAPVGWLDKPLVAAQIFLWLSDGFQADEGGRAEDHPE